MTIDLETVWAVVEKFGLFIALLMAVGYLNWRRVLVWSADIKPLLAEKDIRLADKDDQIKELRLSRDRWQRIAINSYEVQSNTLHKAVGKPSTEDLSIDK